VTGSRLTEVAVHLPSTRLSAQDTERLVAERNPGLDIPHGLVERFSGVGHRHLAPAGWTATDLAAAAAEKLLAGRGLDVSTIDLIIFAATSSAVVEPATAHLVADRLGARCPVFDVKNACNSVVNAIEVADSMIRSGRYHRVLITCGEWLSPGTQWTVASAADYVEAGASYTVSDAGAALLMESSASPGILGLAFGADSAAWPAAVVPVTPDGSGGLRTGRFVVDGHALFRAMEAADLGPITRTVTDLGLTMADFAVVCVHQAAAAYLPVFCSRLGITEEQTVPILAEHGNVASASLPLQLVTAVEAGRVQRGDLVALIGLASGLSFGIVVLRW
jgi:acyl-CoA:acyl-CoA alkyltransferase